MRPGRKPLPGQVGARESGHVSSSPARRAPRRYERDPAARKVIVDVGAAASRRHAVPAWFAVDVTDVRPRLRSGVPVSLTTYVVATVARAVARRPRLHALRDLRGRVVLFDDVDVNVSVEVTVGGQPFPMNHVLRSAQSRPLPDLDAEVHAVAADPGLSDTARLAGPVRAYLALPAPVRRRVLGSLHRFPDRQKALVGTVGVTSVGMYARGGGLGLPFLVHTLDVLVGGLETRAGVAGDGRVVRREHLSVAIVADHDLVDGAPLARFLAELRDDLESGRMLG